MKQKAGSPELLRLIVLRSDRPTYADSVMETYILFCPDCGGTTSGTQEYGTYHHRTLAQHKAHPRETGRSSCRHTGPALL